MATKEDSHRFIERRAKDRKPLPTMEEIRRQMGWSMIQESRKVDIGPLPMLLKVQARV